MLFFGDFISSVHRSQRLELPQGKYTALSGGASPWRRQSTTSFFRASCHCLFWTSHYGRSPYLSGTDKKSSVRVRADSWIVSRAVALRVALAPAENRPSVTYTCDETTSARPFEAPALIERRARGTKFNQRNSLVISAIWITGGKLSESSCRCLHPLFTPTYCVRHLPCRSTFQPPQKRFLSKRW